MFELMRILVVLQALPVVLDARGRCEPFRGSGEIRRSRMVRAGWAVAKRAGIVAVRVVLDAGDSGEPERWRVPLQGPGE